MKKTLRIGGYPRVSKDEQKKFGFSIQAQVDKIENWCNENKYHLVDMYTDEGYTAGNMKRPGLLRMLDDLDKLDVIVFTRLDRFSRNVLEANKMLEMLREHNVNLISIEEDDIDTTTADGMFIFQLKVSLAERELKKGSERIKSVFEYKIKQGQPITGTQPFGYKIFKKDKDKYVGKDEEVSHIIEDMFVHFQTYHSVRATMQYINDKYNLSKCYRSYYDMFKNTYYTGSYKGNDNYCPPYITMQQFIRNQVIIKNNIRERKNKHVHLFTGLIKCPVCGCSFIAQGTKKGGKMYYSYRCNGAYMNTMKKCKLRKSISELIVEKFLLENIEVLANDYILKVSEVKPVKKNGKEKRIKEITSELDRLSYSFHKNRISVEKYDEEYERLEKKLKHLLLNVEEKKDLQPLKEFLNSNWRNVYNELTKENKRALWRNLIKKINIDEDFNMSIDFL